MFEELEHINKKITRNKILPYRRVTAFYVIKRGWLAQVVVATQLLLSAS